MVGIAMAPLAGGLLFDTIGHHHLTMWMTIGVIGLLQTLCFTAFVRINRPPTVVMSQVESAR